MRNKPYTPILVFVDEDEVIEVTAGIVGPAGLKYDAPSERLGLGGFYIAHLPEDHIQRKDKYQDPRTRFEPVDMKKLAMMPEVLKETRELLEKLPDQRDMIPNWLYEKRRDLENKLAQLV